MDAKLEEYLDRARKQVADEQAELDKQVADEQAELDKKQFVIAVKQGKRTVASWNLLISVVRSAVPEELIKSTSPYTLPTDFTHETDGAEFSIQIPSFAPVYLFFKREDIWKDGEWVTAGWKFSGTPYLKPYMIDEEDNYAVVETYWDSGYAHFDDLIHALAAAEQEERRRPELERESIRLQAERERQENAQRAVADVTKWDKEQRERDPEYKFFQALRDLLEYWGVETK